MSNEDDSNLQKRDELREHLTIKVTDDNEMVFKVKRSTKLEKLMNAFCDRQGQSPNSVRFLFEGSRVQPTETPDTLEMQDGDTIEVHQEQIGGGEMLKSSHSQSTELSANNMREGRLQPSSSYAICKIGGRYFAFPDTVM
ncbi:Small ubiquitin-related modifier, SUMO, partial [Metarhizium majus ARSEF 297]